MFSPRRSRGGPIGRPEPIVGAGFRRGSREAATAAQVLVMLRAASQGLRLKEVSTATGLSIAQASAALVTLESRGEAQFSGGHWAAINDFGGDA